MKNEKGRRRRARGSSWRNECKIRRTSRSLRGNWISKERNKWTERRIEKFEGFTEVCREGDWTPERKKLAETTTTIKEHSEDIEFFDADIGTLNRRKIKLEAFRRRENIKIFNVKEKSGENTEELMRRLFVTKLQIPNKDVKKFSLWKNTSDSEWGTRSEVKPPKTSDCKV